MSDAIATATFDVRRLHRHRMSSRRAPNGRTNGQTVEQTVSVAAEQADDNGVDELIRAYQQGHEEALTEIYGHFFDSVYGYARVVLRDEHEAENVAQQVFTKVVEALPEYEIRADQPFRSWLMRVTRNTAIDARRLSSRSTPTDPGQLGVEEPADADTVLSLLTWVKDSDLALFVDRLPESQREVINLRYMLGHDLCEIARILGKSTDAVYRTHSRALRTLEERLTAVGRRPTARRRLATLIRIKPAPVLAARRFALGGSSISRPFAAAASRYRS